MKILHLDIEGYTVYSDGKIFSHKRKRYLSTWINSNGYPTTKVNNRSVPVHRLLAECFIDNPDNLPQVNHIDGNKLNNCLTNLEWCTQKHNLHHAMDNGLHVFGRTPVVGSGSDGFGFWFPSQASTRNKGFSQPLVAKCLKGERDKHKNFTWRYCL